MALTKTQLRNLVQYKNMSDEEFEEAWEIYKLKQEVEVNEDDPRIQEIMDQFEKDYDLTDMNINDTIKLSQISRMTVEIDEWQKIQTRYRLENAVAAAEKAGRIIKELVSNISSLEGDLNISRKNRQSDKGETLHEFLPAILKRAKTFLEERLAYIYCPECKMLVCNTWFTSWEHENTLNLTCPRETCGHKFSVTSQELINNRNSNIDGVLPI